MVVMASLVSSLHGWTVSFQFKRMSTNIKPISPNNAPEHPIEAINLSINNMSPYSVTYDSYLRLDGEPNNAPNTNPHIPAAK
jgi:hypothetical protein